MTPIQILLADDHQIIRQGLRTLIDSEPDMKVVAEATNGREAVQLAAERSPQVVVMDIAMPDLNGLDATRKIVSEHPGTKVVALTAYTDNRMATQMLSAGATGYVAKGSAFQELAEAVRSVVADRVYVSPTIAEALIEGYKRPGTGDGMGGSSSLSPREREVLQLMAEGLATKQIAMHLHVSVKTVETHRRNLMEKLDLYSVAELTKYAIRERLTTIEA